MRLRSIITILLLCMASLCHAQADTITRAKPVYPRLRISIITVGPGERIFEALGHICIRVIDSNRNNEWHDVVFNYGTFDFFEQGWAHKMVSGELLYYLSIFKYDFFLKSFIAPGRSIDEQVLILTPDQTLALISALENNAKPENRYYKYNFFVDNCSTRIYDILRTSLSGLTFGQTLPTGQPITYFDLARQYYKYRHWERVGINIVFAHRMNTVVDNVSAAFLPSYLSKGLENTTLNGNKLCAPITHHQPDTILRQPTTNTPLLLSAAIALLTIAGHTIKPLRGLGKVMRNIVLLSTGLIGCILLYAWFGTSHVGTESNYNLLWALPFNMIVPFLKPGTTRIYALIAMGLIAVSLVLYMLRIHVLPLLELMPLLLAMVIIFASMCRPPYRTET